MTSPPPDRRIIQLVHADRGWRCVFAAIDASLDSVSLLDVPIVSWALTDDEDRLVPVVDTRAADGDGWLGLVLADTSPLPIVGLLAPGEMLDERADMMEVVRELCSRREVSARIA